MMWVVYGMPFVHPNSVLVLTINGIGFVIEAIYIATFFFFSPRALRVSCSSFFMFAHDLLVRDFHYH
jgi:Sugar efflux transporter for intercellular exchange